MKYTFQQAQQQVSDCYESFRDEEADLKQISEVLMGIASLDSDLPLVTGLRTLGIADYSDEERLCLLMLLDDLLYDGLEPLQYFQFRRHPLYQNVLSGIEGLLDRGVLCLANKQSGKMPQYHMAPGTLHLLFGDDYDFISSTKITEQADVIRAKTIQRKELFYNTNLKNEVDRMHQLLSPDRFQTVMDKLRERGRKASASFLLYGPPGSGKTELAKQLAISSGRDIIIADVAKLNGHYHGDTEKNYRNLFSSYRFLLEYLPLAPILFFNEADGILSKRGDILRQAVDKIENRVQNLLLQELEDFEGIFIATTNLTDNIDSAFERRFLYKIKLDQPDFETRCHIWRTLIPELSMEDARVLSIKYPFSGGQISNVATKYDLDVALLDRVPSLQDIISYCETEKIVENETVETKATKRFLELEKEVTVLS